MESRNQSNSKGIDISFYQDEIDFHRVKAAGISFVIIKSTEGLTGTDPMFEKNIVNAKNAGLKVGVYHFCRASDTQGAIQEAQRFISEINHIGGFSVLDIAPCLDIETKEGATKSVVSAICHAWIDVVKQASRMQPILYSYPSFADEELDNTLSNIPLWLANYDVQTPNNHAGWNTWTFLQYSEKGQVDGINSPVDLDEYNGNIEDYMYYTEEDLQMINELKAQVQVLTAEVNELKKYNAMPEIPPFALEAIQLATKKVVGQHPDGTPQFLIDTPNNRSYETYVLATFLHRLGIF